MNFYKTILPVALACCATVGMTSCDDDDTPDRPAGIDQVFTAGVPKSIGDANITTDGQGRVTEIKVDDEYSPELIKFNYTPVTRATTYDVTMDYYYCGEHDYTFYIKLNAQGFAEYVLQVDAEDKEYYPGESNEPDEWFFAYDKDGHLTSMIRSENDSEIEKIIYKNGNVAEVQVFEAAASSPRKTRTIAYTDANTTSLLPNKGGLMLFDDFFDVDLDEGKYLYFAGLLGTATKNLPVGYTEVSTWIDDSTGKPQTDVYTYSHSWVLNAEELPIEYYSIREDGTKELLETFKW